MTQTRTSDEILDREFLEIRAKLLEVGAALDRIDRAEGQPDSSQMDLLQRGLEILLEQGPYRAENIQRLFSREYSESWRVDFGI